MWYLTNNKVEFEGHIFTQVKRELPNGKWEYGGYVEELPKIRGEFWIGKDSYMFKDCVVEGNIFRDISGTALVVGHFLHGNSMPTGHQRV